MIWTDGGWSKFKNEEDADSEANTYRINSYRVLLTRGRDGVIVFVPDEEHFNSTYLENYYCQQVKLSSKYELLTQKSSPKMTLKRAEQAAMDEFTDNVDMLMGGNI